MTTSSLSFWTIDRNTKESEKIKMIQKVEEKANKQFDSAVDGSRLFTQTELAIRSMKYKISTVVSNGEGHIDLLLGQDVHVEVFPAILVYAKVYVKGKAAPLKVFFKYKSK